MILLRHGQSHFNVHYARTRRDPGIVDPALTEEGRRQAEAAAEVLAGHGIERLIVSPYRRTLETAEIVAARLGVPILIEPLVRERACFACDIGSPRSTLEERWPTLDFGDLAETWWPQDEEPESDLLVRCRRFLARMAGDAGWRESGIVTHWGFIRGITGEGIGNCETAVVDPTRHSVAQEA